MWLSPLKSYQAPHPLLHWFYVYCIPFRFVCAPLLFVYPCPLIDDLYVSLAAPVILSLQALLSSSFLTMLTLCLLYPLLNIQLSFQLINQPSSLWRHQHSILLFFWLPIIIFILLWVKTERLSLLCVLLEHNNQWTNTLRDYCGLQKTRGMVKEIFIYKGSHWLMETPRE